MRLIIDELAVKRGLRTIISGLSFHIESKEGLLLTGPNGSGKTTLLRALAGFIEHDAGTVRLEGGADEAEVGEQCHYVGHKNGIKHGFTVAENLDFWLDYLGGAEDDTGQGKRSCRDTALETFELTNLLDIPAGMLSAGQKRRLGLARLVMVKRPVWLLDEPSVSLDVHSVKILAGVVEEHIRGGGIAMAATHIPLGLEFNRTLQLGIAQETEEVFG